MVIKVYNVHDMCMLFTFYYYHFAIMQMKIFLTSKRFSMFNNHNDYCFYLYKYLL